MDRVFVDERRGTWELYFLRVCACLCRSPPWNREWRRSQPDRERCPNPCLVCFDCQLFLCPTFAEGTIQKGKRVVAPHPVTFLTELQVEFLGIFISILGAVTVMFSANTSDTRLDRDALIVAITQKPFIIYSIIYIIGTFALAGLYWPADVAAIRFSWMSGCARFLVCVPSPSPEGAFSQPVQESSPCYRQQKRCQRFSQWNG